LTVSKLLDKVLVQVDQGLAWAFQWRIASCTEILFTLLYSFCSQNVDQPVLQWLRWVEPEEICPFSTDRCWPSCLTLLKHAHRELHTETFHGLYLLLGKY